MKEEEIKKRLETWVTKNPIQSLNKRVPVEIITDPKQKFYELPEELNGSSVETVEKALGIKISELGSRGYVMGGQTFANRLQPDVCLLVTNPNPKITAQIKKIGGREPVRGRDIWIVKKGEGLYQVYKEFSKEIKILNDIELEKNIEKILPPKDRFVEELMADMKELF